MTHVTQGQIEAFFQLLRDKKVTPKRMTDILKSGILADVLDPEAHLLSRRDVRKALWLEPLTERSDETKTWGFFYSMGGHPELHLEALIAVEEMIGGSLYNLAKDEKVLREKINALDVRQIKNRLLRGGIIGEISVEKSDNAEMCRELGDYVIAYFTICTFQNVTPVSIGMKHLFDLLPNFGKAGADSDVLLETWLRGKCKEHGLDDERTAFILNQCGLGM